MNTNYIQYNNESLKSLLNSNELYKIIPGSFIHFKGDTDAYIIEKVLKDKLVVAKYSYTKFPSNIDSEYKYVKSEKFIIDENTPFEVVGISTPK